MDAPKPQAAVYALWAVLGLGAAALLYALVKRTKAVGGIVGGVGEIILGPPAEVSAGSVVEYAATTPPSEARNLQRLVGRFLSPLEGGVVSRLTYFGSEFRLRFEVENLSMAGRDVTVKLVLTEEDINRDSPISYDLGTYSIPPAGGIRAEGKAKIATVAIVTGRLDVTARLYANGFLVDAISFRVS